MCTSIHYSCFIIGPLESCFYSTKCGHCFFSTQCGHWLYQILLFLIYGFVQWITCDLFVCHIKHVVRSSIANQSDKEFARLWTDISSASVLFVLDFGRMRWSYTSKLSRRNYPKKEYKGMSVCRDFYNSSSSLGLGLWTLTLVITYFFTFHVYLMKSKKNMHNLILHVVWYTHTE